MKNPSSSRTLRFATLAGLYTLVPAHSAILARYEFASASPVATTSLAGVTAGNFGASITDTNQGFSAGGNVFLRSLVTGADQTAALADDNYFSVTISATNPGETLNLTSLTLDYAVQNDNASSFSGAVYLQSTVGGTGTGNPVIAGTGTTDTQNSSGFSFAQATFDLSAAGFQGLTSITFQFRFSDTADVTGDLNRMDNVTINGSVVPEPSSALIGGLGVLVLLRRRRI